MKEKFQIRDLRRKEKFQIDDEYLNGYAKICGIYATGVYTSLCRHSSKYQECFPSKKLIAEELNISESQVYRALKILVSWDIISIQRQGRRKDGSYLNNIYILIDKTCWKSKPKLSTEKPQVYRTDGLLDRSPQVYDDISRRSARPNKDTHPEKDTHCKEKHFLNIGRETVDKSGYTPPTKEMIEALNTKNFGELFRSVD